MPMIRETIVTTIDGVGIDQEGIAQTKAAMATGAPIIASGGVSSIEDVIALSGIAGLEGIIAGRAIYEGRLDVAAAIGVLS